MQAIDRMGFPCLWFSAFRDHRHRRLLVVAGMFSAAVAFRKRRDRTRRRCLVVGNGVLLFRSSGRHRAFTVTELRRAR